MVSPPSRSEARWQALQSAASAPHTSRDPLQEHACPGHRSSRLTSCFNDRTWRAATEQGNGFLCHLWHPCHYFIIVCHSLCVFCFVFPWLVFSSSVLMQIKTKPPTPVKSQELTWGDEHPTLPPRRKSIDHFLISLYVNKKQAPSWVAIAFCLAVS